MARCRLWPLFLLLWHVAAGQLVKIERCDPKQFTKKAHPAVNTSYLYCNTDGSLAKRDCPTGKRFNAEMLECEQAASELGGFSELQQSPPAAKPEAEAIGSPAEGQQPAEMKEKETEPEDSVLKQPQFQAPEDICSGGNPLTKLGAPVVCNPTVSSCPDGYLCTLHQRTGISYCCQTAVDLLQESTLCAGNQVTFFEPLTGLPKTCALSAQSGCPTGFGCNLVGGSFTRCCGRDFGCPANSAGFVHPTTGSYVQCNSADPLSCPGGFLCTQSSMFNTGICCSDTSNSPVDVCGGEAPLSQPNPCSASDPCPVGYGCRNGRCCASKGVCPVGTPLGGVTSCSGAGNPCPNNFQCVTNNGHQYCCPSPEHVCGLPKDPGIPCQARGVPAVSRFYFDASTGSCRSFQFSQCGGNGNSFDSLEQCEGFCLEAQCPQGGTGLRAGPALATCTPGDQQQGGPGDTCPSHFVCVQPRFGQNFVCCSSQEQVCREPVSAGTPCFGTFLTVQRFQYSADRQQCEAFQYYGCSGTGNNFPTKGQCETQCLPTVRSACNGVAPLNDEGDYVQRCTENVQCPTGSWCNSQGYCCPHQETACTSPKSIGHTCLSQKPGTFWFFDSAADGCLPFEYSGCGGTPNRFADREACEQMCGPPQGGDCPRGMAPFLTPAGPKRCQPGDHRDCPSAASCVQSSQSQWLCCTSVAQCPNGRGAYLIPGSDSNVACLPDDDNCPGGFQCLQSANVPGYYMCCSGNAAPARLARIGSFTSAVVSAVSAAKRRAMSSLLANLGAAQSAALVRYAAAAPKCPSGLLSNGERCVVNQIQACPLGYICIGNDGSKGVCCKAQPKCVRKSRKPVYIAPRQVLTCGEEEAGCPQGSQCSRSSLPGIHICCMARDSAVDIGFVVSGPPKSRPDSSAASSSSSASSSAASSASSSSSSSAKHHSYSKGAVPKVVPKCAKDGSLPFFALGSRVPQQCTAEREDECPEEFECEQGTDGQNVYCCPAWDRCPAGASAFLVEGSRKPLGCNWMANNCPDGYTCEGSKDRAICCRTRPNQLQCPVGRSPYLYGKRPLACPSGSKRSCPHGFECSPSLNGGNQHLCCSTPDHHTPECVTGFGYIDPATARNQICDPVLEACPLGYRCKRSTLANTHVCCSMALDNRYDGFCPAGQIPFTGLGAQAAADDFLAPPSCHMALSPCPNQGPFQCVYSAEKQNSFCCAPVETAHRFGAFRPAIAASVLPSASQTQQQQWQQAMQMQQQQQQLQQLQQMQFHQRSVVVPQPQTQQTAPAAASGCGGGGDEMAQPQQQQIGPVNLQMGAGQQQQHNYQQQQMVQEQLQRQQQQQQQQQSSPYSAAEAWAALYAGYGGSTSPGNSQQQPLGQQQPMQPQQMAMNNYTSQSQQQQQQHGDGQQHSSALFVASCPPWSKPLLEPGTGLGRPCSAWVRCPGGFTCYSNFPDGRSAHCCTTVPLDNQVVFRANTALALLSDGAQKADGQSQSATNPGDSGRNPFGLQFAPPKMVNQTSVEAVGNLTKSNSTDGEQPKQWTRCPAHTVNIGGFCKRMFFVGQPGCEVDSQCSARTDGTSCVKGYCACPAPLLIYESKCVLQCPDGFLNIAGRCHDLTSIVFMDSVEERENGTIGGFCLATVVAEEQCEVENAYCSEKSLTCQCQPGYQLRIEEISNRTEKGVCMEVEGSRFQGAAASRRMRDQVEDDANLETFGVGPTFYAVEFSADAANETVEATEKTGKNNSQSQSMEEEKSGSKNIEELSKKEKEEVSEEGLKAPSRNAHANESLSDDDGTRSTRQEEERVLFQADD